MILTLKKEDQITEIFKLLLHYLKITKNVSINIDYKETFSFECDNKKVYGFLGCIYKILNVFNCFDDIFNTKESDISKTEEILFYLENKNFKLDNYDLKNLNEVLKHKSFVNSESYLSILDIFYFYIIYEYMKKLSLKDKCDYVNICRWFLYLQDILLKDYESLEKIDFKESLENILCFRNTDNVKNENIKKREQNKNKNENIKKTDQNKNENIKRTDQNKNENIKKKDKNKNQNIKKENQIKDTRELDDISRLNILVGYVEEVEIHPNADTLYCLKVNIGEENIRDICSGLRNIKKPEDILNKYVLVLENLKEKTLRGKKSHGMILCGSYDTSIELLIPPNGAKIGERIICEDMDINLLPDKVLSFDKNKNPFYHIQPNLLLKDGIAYYKDKKFISSKGDITCILKTGSIS